MKIIASMGHAEYSLPETEGVTVKQLWQWDGEPDREPDTADWERVTGLDAIQMPDCDLSWETVVAIEGEHENIELALIRMLPDLTSSPGADDGTFDYWPSGMRFAFAIDEALGNPMRESLEAIARTVIFTTDEHGYNRSDYAYELLDKIGMYEEAKQYQS